MDFKNFKPNKLSKKVVQIQGRVLGSIQVARTGNPHFPSELSIYRIGSSHFAVLHSDEGLPSYNDVYHAEDFDYYKVSLSRAEAMCIVNGIQFWDENKTTHINPYATLFTYCKVKGLDLVEMKILRT